MFLRKLLLFFPHPNTGFPSLQLVSDPFRTLFMRECTTNSSSIDNYCIRKYVRCGKMIEARQAFSSMDIRDVYTWTILLSGYVKQGNPKEALNLFHCMLKDNIDPNAVTLVCALKASAFCLSLDVGKVIHSNIVEIGIEYNVFIGSTLIDMYSKCGDLENAAHVFASLHTQNTVSWTAMIAGYTRHGLAFAALEIFWNMRFVIAPNEVTYANALNACSLIPSLEQGRLIHDSVVRCGYECDCFVGNSTIDMYISCTRMDCAYDAFDKMTKKDVVSWNIIIAGYAHHGAHKRAMMLFHEMIKRKEVTPDKTTFLSALKACSHLQDVHHAEHLYAHIRKSRVELDVALGTSVLDMFVKCGCIKNAYQVFRILPKQDVVAWTTLISGFVNYGYPAEALRLFNVMKRQEVRPDRLTFISVLNACTALADLDMGERIHADVICAGLESCVCLGSSLVDMYSKCGSLHKAMEAFDALPKKDVIAWNALVVGYSQHGDSNGLNTIFKQMGESHMELDNVTYLSILSACSHCGLLDEGSRLVSFMLHDCGNQLGSEHFSCIVDLLSRMGLLSDAEAFIMRMPFQPCVGIWTSLLGACRTYYNLEMAEFAMNMVQELEPRNIVAPVLLSNMLSGI